MPIYKIKEQIMKNLLFTSPKRIFTEHLYVTYHIYIYIYIYMYKCIYIYIYIHRQRKRSKQQITNIEIQIILITITTTAIILIINNTIENIHNNTLILTIVKRKETKKAQKTSTHTHTLKTSKEFSNFNVHLLDIHSNLFELCFL